MAQEAWERTVHRKVWGLMYMTCCGIIDFAKEDVLLRSQGSDLLAFALNSSMEFMLDHILGCELRTFTYQVFASLASI